ncbi:MAG: shikimate dehydrogenase family protein, partial [Caulobacterales bacterium]
MKSVSARTVVAGIVGAPVSHSLSPLIHNAWLSAAGLDAIYVAFRVRADGFAAFAEGLRGGAVRGLNVTVPFKEAALAAADEVSPRAARSGAANLLIFEGGGAIRADNIDGVGLLAALAAQAPGFDPAGGPAVILGAGGAARGAAAAFVEAGAPEVRLVNRTLARAAEVAEALDGPVKVFAWDDVPRALAGAGALINATTLGLAGGQPLDLDLDTLPPAAVVMDMVYRPLHTRLLVRAKTAGHPIVDGLEMLIRQAEPSFRAFFSQTPPA